MAATHVRRRHPGLLLFKIAMICSSPNLLRFIFVRLLRVGLYSKSVTFQDSTSSKLKHFRRVATRYDKLAANFLAMVHLASMRLWLRAYESTV
ncbi:transposase [Sphingobium sp. B8D3C]|nr:transposase [Sphingobium sp. B8D3B]MCW2396663.1 transposase [Sphingobium sp. B8D3B]MCW2420166.1 transposase [Sphingobium sp. B8D3C]MCW2420180.1 transposase [Sphingobium sp. B8D3C]